MIIRMGIIILNIVVKGPNDAIFGSFQDVVTEWSNYGK